MNGTYVLTLWNDVEPVWTSFVKLVAGKNEEPVRFPTADRPITITSGTLHRPGECHMFFLTDGARVVFTGDSVVFSKGALVLTIESQIPMRRAEMVEPRRSLWERITEDDPP